MNSRGGLKVSRDTAVFFARNFRRDRQRSYFTTPLRAVTTIQTPPSQIRPRQRYVLQAPLSVVRYGVRCISGGANSSVEPHRQAWLGNPHGGLRRGDKGEFSPWISTLYG